MGAFRVPSANPPPNLVLIGSAIFSLECSNFQIQEIHVGHYDIFSHPTDLQGQGQCQGHFMFCKWPRVTCIPYKILVTLALIVKSRERKVDF